MIIGGRVKYGLNRNAVHFGVDARYICHYFSLREIALTEV